MCPWHPATCGAPCKTSEACPRVAVAVAAAAVSLTKRLSPLRSFYFSVSFIMSASAAVHKNMKKKRPAAALTGT